MLKRKQLSFYMITIIILCLYIRCILFQNYVGLLIIVFLILILLFDDIVN